MRIASKIYGLLSYTLFLLSFLYAIVFVGDFAAPKTIDYPLVDDQNPWWALVINCLVLALFAIQHSVMARPAFKRWWTRLVPPSIERSTYVLAASALLVLIFVAWQPLPVVLWDVRETTLGAALLVLSACGWLIVLLSTFMISHFELFGLTQAWYGLRARVASSSRLQVRYLYRFVRHPIMLGFVIAFWATPTMTQGHLLFAAMTTAYILVGILLEEHDLETEFGDTYRRYRRLVPMLVPRVGHGRRQALDALIGEPPKGE